MKTAPTIDFGPHDGPAVCVVGSLNADLIAYESDTWIPGAYNVGDRFELGAGGKGLNVAMSIAATGLPSYLVGRVGNDMFGNHLKRALTLGSVSQDFVKTDSTAFTGVGHVRVNAHRDYDTCVVPGANDRVDSTDTKTALGQPNDALPIVRRAVTLDPGLVPARMALARTFWALSQRDEAVRAAREALDLARTDAERQTLQRMIESYSR